MSLRRILAELADPDVRDEMRELREIAIEAEQARHDTVARMFRMRAEHAAALAITEGLLKAAERDARQAKADVARLLEASAQCAHEHHDQT